MVVLLFKGGGKGVSVKPLVIIFSKSLDHRVISDDSVHDLLLNKFSDLGLHQMVLEPTRDKNILDIVLVSDSLTFLDYTIDQPLGTSDHNSVLFNLTFASARSSQRQCRQCLSQRGDVGIADTIFFGVSMQLQMSK